MQSNNRNRIVCEDANRITFHCTRWFHEENRGKLAQLERGNAYPLIFPLIQNDYNRNRAEDVGLLVGQCFGISRKHEEMGNFGSSMRRLLLKFGTTGGGNGVKTRANRIIMSDGLESLARMLPGMVQWLKQNSVAINFRRLYMDLYFWNSKTQRRWASDFYGGRREN